MTDVNEGPVMTRPETPIERLRHSVEYSGGGENTFVTLRLDIARLLLDLVDEAGALLRRGDDDYDRICGLLGELHGEERHTWGPWGWPAGPYQSPLGLRIDRKCDYCWTFESREATDDERRGGRQWTSS